MGTMNHRASRSTTIKSAFAQLSDFLLNGETPKLKEGLLLNQVERNYNWQKYIIVGNGSNSKSKLAINNIPIDLEQELHDSESENQDPLEILDFEELTEYEFKEAGSKLKLDKQNQFLHDLNSLYDSQEDEEIPEITHGKAASDTVINAMVKDLCASELNQSQKVFLFSGLFTNQKNENEKRINFEIPRTKLVQKDFKLPWNIYCPGKMEAVQDVSQIEGVKIIDDYIGIEKIENMPVTKSNTEIIFSRGLASKHKKWALTKAVYIQNGVELYDTSFYGSGLRAVREYKEGELIMEYLGDIQTYEEFENAKNKNYGIHFIDGFVINSYTNASLARFINHSHQPTCEYKIFLDLKKQPRVGVFLKGLSTGDLITVNYNWNRIYKLRPERCFCGAKSCTGFIRKNFKWYRLARFTADHTLGPKKLKKLLSQPESEFLLVRGDATRAELAAIGTRKQRKGVKNGEENGEIVKGRAQRESARGRKRAKTNGALGFDRLPANLQKQLGIDMVVRNL